jgi:hypothetical protein
MPYCRSTSRRGKGTRCRRGLGRLLLRDPLRLRPATRTTAQQPASPDGILILRPFANQDDCRVRQ